MNAKRLNLIGCVRAALEQAGYSTVKVVNAVNSALGQLDVIGSESKLGTGSVSKKGYRVSESTTTKYSGAVNVPLHFDAWHSAMAKADKVAEMDTVSIPAVFTAWLQSMKVDAPKAESKAVAPAATPELVPAGLTAKVAAK